MNILSENVYRALQRNNTIPQIVLEIEGVSEKFSTTNVKKLLRYGDPLARYGEGLEYGGFLNLTDIKPYLNDDGSSLGIKQTLEPDKGRSSSVTTLSLKLIDKAGKITKLISPGQEVEDILYRRAKIWISFGEKSSFKEDFEILFRGNISGVHGGSGFVTFEISSPEQKKRTALFPKAENDLDLDILVGDNTVALLSTENLVPPPKQISMYSSVDNSLKSYIKVGDELIRFDNIVGNILTGCQRGQLGTAETGHLSGETTESFYVLEGNALDLALKLQLSSESGDPYIKDLRIGSVNQDDSGGFYKNTFIAYGVDLIKEYNIQKGDWLYAKNFGDSGNIFDLDAIQVEDITVRDHKSYVQVGFDLTTRVKEETGTISVLSKYNTLGYGLGLTPDEVDIEQFEFIRKLFLSSADVKFYIKDTIENVKDFIGQELLKPFAAFEIPRFSRSSVGFHSPPIPNQDVIVLNSSNIVSSKDIVVQRRVTKNFYNSIIHKYEDQIEDDKFLRAEVTIDGESTSRIPIGNKPLVIESKGMREDLGARLRANQASSRLLKKYKYGAEYIENLKINFKTGFQLEIGSSVILDPEGLKIINTSTGKRDKGPTVYQVVNKAIELKTGKVQVTLEDASFSLDNRYGLYSPASKVGSVVDASTFFIKQWQDFSEFGASEYRKWSKLLFKNQELKVLLRNEDFSIKEEAVIKEISFNKVILKNDLSITLEQDMIMELADYSSQTSENIKLTYAHLEDDEFPNGDKPYVYI